MLNCAKFVDLYINCCEYQKNLSKDTIKAYKIDLKQFIEFCNKEYQTLSKDVITNYIEYLNTIYKPRTAKRKIASIKAFCAWLEFEERIEKNPFDKLKIKFNEPFILPRTIPLDTVELILSVAYINLEKSKSKYVLRDVAILEMLFALGIRVSELCNLKPNNVDLHNGTVLIFGKGAKERNLQIGNPDVLHILQDYKNTFKDLIDNSGWFFVNRLKNRYSEQSVRSMICKYIKLANLPIHITPHMFRHTFATQLLEEDVDIRYIQALLGHSSIATTQIYTHVTNKKQKEILSTKHPRNRMKVN